MTDVAPAAPAADPTSTWDAIAASAQQVLTLLQPVLDGVSIVNPALGAGISLAEKIAQGVLSLEPNAVAIYERFTSGNPPTAEEVAAYEATYEADYQKLKADIAAARAAALAKPS